MRPVILHVLPVDIFSAIAIIIIYLSFTDPQFYLDTQSTAFNYSAFMKYTAESLGNKDLKILALTIHNYIELQEIYGNNQMDTVIKPIRDYLQKEYPRLIIFYYKPGCFAMIGDANTTSDVILSNIIKRFKSPWICAKTEVYLTARGVSLDSDIEFHSANELAKVLNYAIEKAETLENTSILYVDEKDQEICNRKSKVKKYLEHAVEHNQVQVYLQPIVSTKTGKVEGAEALCRIFDDEGKMISPLDFIPLAEKNGQIIRLGEQVFEKTCRFISEHSPEISSLKWVNVNLSPLQFFKRDLANSFLQIAENYHVAPSMIHLEITEENMIDYALFSKQILALTGKGFCFVLDDYGTGYSNLDRLTQCPFINIKLDRTVVMDYHNNSKVLLPHLVDAFKQIGFSITAEGIETTEMAESMAELGCDYLQGFLYSRPIPMEEFVEKYS
ncbi:MAG: EAL domain-containing protein [Acetatifactor sp.]|nr:EAL domain-containing protein [Acetatifactor sp.]